jgi:hypothetical protein
MANDWKSLHRERFAELPFDCGNEVDPGITDSPDFRDWTAKPPTPDQRRIERYLDRFDLRGRRILHIGIGSSRVAKRFSRRALAIVGTSIDQPELEAAANAGLANYRAVRHNKYGGTPQAVPGRFDFIVDNNPTSACCCMRHLSQLFEFLNAKLADDGQIVTEAEGLGWVPAPIHPRWRFDFDDLAAAAAVAGLRTYRVHANIIVMARRQPPKPGLVALSLHAARQAVGSLRTLLGLPLRAAKRLRRRAAR